jgi:hypothetical protein
MRHRLPTAPTVPSDDPAFSAPEKVKLRGVDSDPPEALRVLPGDVIRLTTVSAKPKFSTRSRVYSLSPRTLPVRFATMVN